MDNGSKWWVSLIEGIIAILLGLYLLFGGNAAAGNIALVAGVFMFIAGVLALFRRSDDAIGRYQGIVAVIVGALLLFLYAFDILGFYWDMTIFAIGAILVGLLGLYANLFDRRGRDFSWGRVLFNALLVLWGIMIFFSRMQDFDLQFWTAIILIALGVILALWGFFSRDDGETAEEDDAAKDVPDEVPPEETVSKIEDTLDDASDEAS